MLELRADPSFAGRSFAALEVVYPGEEQWDKAGFETLKEERLAALRQRFRDYDRKAVFGENPWSRYFKKYKKSYPIMMQLESYLLKGRPFSMGRPVNEVAFLTELETGALLGTHDVERIQGPLEVFCDTEKTPYIGLRGDQVHTYPGDISGRDGAGIILNMIAGADGRTCLRPESRHVAYMVFAPTGMEREVLEELLDRLSTYAAVLCPTAEQYRHRIEG